MSSVVKTQPDSDLALVIKEAEHKDGQIRVEVGDEVYVLLVRREGCHEREDIWAGYDPEKVREALRQSAGILADVDTGELLADLRIQRGQDSLGRPA